MADVNRTYTYGDFEANRLALDIGKRIALLYPDTAPLVRLLSELPDENADDMKFEWYEDDFQARTDMVNGAILDGVDTTIVVDNSERFQVNDVVLVVSTGERFLVTSIDTSTDTLTVTRGFGETAAAAIADNATLLRLGPAAQEGAEAVSGIITGKTSVYNYCQDFRSPISMSDIARKTKLRTGDAWGYEESKAAKEHVLQMERAFIFGERTVSTDATTGKKRWATRGLAKFLTENNYAVGGALTEAGFEDWLEDAMKYGNKTKTLFANSKLMTLVNGFGRSNQRVKPGAKEYGIAVTTYHSVHGDIKIIKHHVLDDYSANGYGLLVDLDPECVNRKVFSDTKQRMNVQDPSKTERLDEYETIAGLKLSLPKRHALISGATS
jgi:hypothetical protein